MGSDAFAVNLGHWGLCPECAGQECLIRAVSLVERIVFLFHRNVVCAAEVDDLLTGHAVHAVVTSRGPNLSATDDEEVTRIRGVHKAIGIQHQRLISARLFCLKAGDDAVQLRVAVVFRVLRHRQTAHLRHSC